MFPGPVQLPKLRNYPKMFMLLSLRKMPKMMLRLPKMMLRWQISEEKDGSLFVSVYIVLSIGSLYVWYIYVHGWLTWQIFMVRVSKFIPYMYRMGYCR